MKSSIQLTLMQYVASNRLQNTAKVLGTQNLSQHAALHWTDGMEILCYITHSPSQGTLTPIDYFRVSK